MLSTIRKGHRYQEKGAFMQVLTVNYDSPQAPYLFCHSLRETGFAVLSHHPIATQLIDQAYQQWQEFFYSDTKHDYTYQKPSQAGYFPFRTESAKRSEERRVGKE